MSRQRTVISNELAYRVVGEAYEAGIRTISFYSGGEPFLNRQLADYVWRAKEIGFDYVYLSTNGGRAVTPRLGEVLDAGLDSLKFSINAGTREVYQQVHGLDEFDEVMRNLEFCAEHRARTGGLKKLFVSFVETKLNRDTVAALRERVAELVDEVVVYPFVVIGTPLDQRLAAERGRPVIDYGDTDKTEEWNEKRLKLPCYQLWSYLNVTVEGYLSACCSDYNDDLVVGNLHDSSLVEAWHSEEFQELRTRHLEGQVEGTLCNGCVIQAKKPYKPLNTHLMTAGGGRDGGTK
jgi:MoaA/NifB/PqqE/SkfB family radical SAM enzyme